MAEPPPAPEQIEAWRAALHSANPLDCLAAIEAIIDAAARAAVGLHRAMASLVPDLVQLLTSQAHVPCTSRAYEFSGHALIAESATSAIECIGTAPDYDALRDLLADGRIFVMPEASYDQGAYIGDYSSEMIAPAGFAGRLSEMLGLGAFGLLDELAQAARHEDRLIAWPSQRCIMRLADRAHHATPAERDRLALLAGDIEAMPEVAAPTTSRGFALRDLARHMRKRLAAF